MKKIISFFICTLLAFFAVYPAVSAESEATDTERFDDGSYLTVTYREPSEGDDEHWEDISAPESAYSPIEKIIRWFRSFLEKLFARQSTVTKYKYCNYFDSEGKLLWSVRLKGTFTYNHRKAVCVDSDITCEIRDGDWKLLSSSHTEDGSRAEGTFSIRQYKLGVPLKLIEKALTLTCDKEGNVK